MYPGIDADLIILISLILIILALVFIGL